MADIVNVREFNSNLRNFTPGQTLIVVDAVRRRVICSLTVNKQPESVEKVIRVIYR
jgi:hypothetical protein